MTMKKFAVKGIFPVIAVGVCIGLFYPLCVENGVCDYWKLFILAGIPFGVHRMYFWLIPKGFDLGGTVGMFVINLLIGGVIGSAVLLWRLLTAIFTLATGVFFGIRWVAGIRR